MTEEPFPNAEELERLVQFQHPWKVLGGLPGVDTLDEATVARLLATDEQTYRGIRAAISARADEQVAAILADEVLTAAVDALPFAPGDVVVAFGDSLTADLGSWAEMLARALAARRGADGITVVNAGVSGETSTDALKRLVDVAARQPAWVIVLVGTNDSRHHGRQVDAPLVSREETERNLDLIRAFVEQRTKARLVWMTPPPAIPEVIGADRRFADMELMWVPEEIEARAELVRAQPGTVIDLHAAFGSPPPRELFLGDGLHPSSAGQRLMLRTLLSGLAAPGWASA